MPVSFPNMDSLKFRAAIRGFRQPSENETEKDYRTSFADFMRSVDTVESSEIRSGKGWDEQTPQELLINVLGSEQALENLLKDLELSNNSDKEYIDNLLSYELSMYDLGDGKLDVLTFHEFEFDATKADLESIREVAKQYSNLVVIQLNTNVNKVTVMNISLFIKFKAFFKAYVYAEQEMLERDNEMYAAFDDLEENQNVNGI